MLFGGASSRVVAARARSVVALALGLVLLLGLVVAPPARASTLTLRVDSWNVNEATGAITYDLALSDSCEATSCGYRIDAFYVNGTTERLQGTVASGSVPGSSSSPSPFSRDVVGSTTLPEVTHIRATLMSRTSSLVMVSPGYRDGSASITVYRWDVNHGSGTVSYDFDVSFTGAAQVGAPCDGACYLWVDGFYKSGTTEMNKRSFTGGGTYHGGLWTYTRKFSGTSVTMPELTDLRARLSSGTTTNEVYAAWAHVSDPYPTGGVDVVVNKWDLNPATGAVTYDFDVLVRGAAQVGGPCDGACYLWVDGFYKSATSSTRKHSFSGGGLAVGGSWTYSKKFTGSGQLLPELTDIRARLGPDESIRETYEGWSHVSDGYPDGKVSITVNKWSRDQNTGVVSYDFDVAFSGAAQINGPCDGGCYLWVDAFYRDGTSSVLQKSFTGGGTAHGGAWTYSRKFTAADVVLPEVTDIRARLTPDVSTREVYETWAHVSNPYASSDLSISVNSWDRDPSSGKVTFDFDVVVSGAAQVNGSCDGGCYLWIEGVTPNGTTEVVSHSFSGGGLYLGAPWTYTKSYAGTDATLPSFTSLRATLSPAAGGTRPKLVARAGVGTLTVGGYDFEYVVQFVAARNLDQAQMCALVQDLTNETNIDPDSPTPATKACWSAATVRGAIKAMAAVMGGIGVIKLVQYFTNGEGGGSIAQPKPGPAPEPYPEEPPPDPAPEPQPEPIGSGEQPPANCITDLAARLELLRSLPDQDHHIATNKNRIADPKWTVQFEDLLWRFFPDQVLSGAWNVLENLPHRGSHPYAYHAWVYQNMLKALLKSNGDWSQFIARWNAWVRDVVRNDPTITRREYWSCND